VLLDECCINYLQSFCENDGYIGICFFHGPGSLKSWLLKSGYLQSLKKKKKKKTSVELLQDYSIIMMILKSHHRIINVSSI
jgi:hypothetical protein